MGGWSVPTDPRRNHVRGVQQKQTVVNHLRRAITSKFLARRSRSSTPWGGCAPGARLSDIAEACHLDLATALRILHTLQRHGWVAKDARTKKFKLLVGSRPYRVGYAQLRGGLPFSDAVTHGLVEAARLALVELLPLDNEFDAAKGN